MASYILIVQKLQDKKKRTWAFSKALHPCSHLFFTQMLPPTWAPTGSPLCHAPASSSSPSSWPFSPARPSYSTPQWSSCPSCTSSWGSRSTMLWWTWLWLTWAQPWPEGCCLWSTMPRGTSPWEEQAAWWRALQCPCLVSEKRCTDWTQLFVFLNCSYSNWIIVQHEYLFICKMWCFSSVFFCIFYSISWQTLIGNTFPHCVVWYSFTCLNKWTLTLHSLQASPLCARLLWSQWKGCLLYVSHWARWPSKSTTPWEVSPYPGCGPSRGTYPPCLDGAGMSWRV